MRSELVGQASKPIRNRYLLVQVASTLTRKFHRPRSVRVQDSINESLAGLGQGRYFVWPDRTIAGIASPEAKAIAMATGQLVECGQLSESA